MAYPRTHAEIEALEPTEAERKLLDACRAGEPCELGPDRPEGPSPERSIRAEILRYLILGGCTGHPGTERGVRLIGAYVEGELDLDWTTAIGPTYLDLCRFERPVSLSDATLRSLSFDGSHLPGLNAHRTRIPGNVFLRAQGATPFHATGEVRLSGARIGGQVSCSGGRFEHAGGVALDAQGVRVAEGLVWRNVKAGDGVYIFGAAHAGVLVDDVSLWPNKGLILDGFTYDRIVGATDAAARLDWLAKGTRRNGEFYPQPYGQCARVLREMGHGREAREILYERERLLRAEARKRTLFLRPVLWFWNGLERWVVGYGLKPARSLIVALGLWAACTLLAHLAWNAGEMAPNAGPLLSQQEWQTAYATDNPPEDWAATAVGTSWEKFSPVFYGFDVVVPLIEIGQTSAWGPMVDDSKPIGWGYVLWRAQWVFGVAGWVVALLATAGLTGALSSRKD